MTNEEHLRQIRTRWVAGVVLLTGLMLGSVPLPAQAATTLQDLTYGYDTGGNVTSITDSINGNQTFSYDELDRLTNATGPYGSFTYGYNEIGNLTTNPQVGSYTYPSSGPTSVQPHAVTAAGGNTYTYDANGNLASGAGRTISYDIENRPTSIISGGTTTTFVYDGDGKRVKKTVGTTTTIYVSKLYECESNTGGTFCTKFILVGQDKRLAMKQVGGSQTVDYYHPDHLGSTSVMTTEAGVQQQAVTYYPFGNVRSNSGSINVPYQYTGKELDASTGLMYYEARYYDATLGRFISADTIIARPRDPQDLNRYAYARNNPLLYTDPTGHFFKIKIKNIGDVFKAVGWVVAPGVMAYVDESTRRYAIAATATAAGFAAAGPVGAKFGFLAGGLVGGTVAGATNAGLSGAFGYDVDAGRMVAAGAAAGLVTAGMGHYLNPLAAGAAGGATSAAVSGGDPGSGALIGVVSTLGMAALQYAYYAATLPTYDGGQLPPNSVGYALPKDLGSALISLIDGGAFSHTFAVGNDGLPYGATPGGSGAVLGQFSGAEGSLLGRQILVMPGVLSETAGFFAMHSRQLSVSYSAVNISGMNCACFTAGLMNMSGHAANGLSPNAQYYGTLIGR